MILPVKRSSAIRVVDPLRKRTQAKTTSNKPESAPIGKAVSYNVPDKEKKVYTEEKPLNQNVSTGEVVDPQKSFTQKMVKEMFGNMKGFGISPNSAAASSSVYKESNPVQEVPDYMTKVSSTAIHLQDMDVPSVTLEKPEYPDVDKNRTGWRQVEKRLKQLSADSIEKEQRQLLKGKKADRSRQLKLIQLQRGMKSNNMTDQSEFMISKVPIIPCVYRPFVVMDNKISLGDVNELYTDLYHTKNQYKSLQEAVGDEGAIEEYKTLEDQTGQVFGFNDSPNVKLKQSGTQGFLGKITGSVPKFGWVQSKLTAKPVDNVQRGVITPNPELKMDEISIPEDMAFEEYKPHIQKRLRRQGISPIEQLRHIKNRTKIAEMALQEEMKIRPVIYSRQPSWYKYNVLQAYPKIHKEGSSIQISPYVQAGLNADYDGDQINVHVPILDDTLQEAKEKLLPNSRNMLFDIRDFESVKQVPKHEQVSGLYQARMSESTKKYRFKTKQEQIDKIKSGEVRPDDEVEIG